MPTKVRTSYLRERLKQFGMPNYFSGSQEEYVASRNKGVRMAKELISSGPSDDLFDRCYSICAETRRNYAIKQGGKDGNSFGVRRTSHFLAFCTALSDPRYSEYGDRLRRLLSSAVTKDLKSRPFAALREPQVVRESVCEGMASVLEYRLMPEGQMDLIANRERRIPTSEEHGTDQYGRPCFTEKFKTNAPERYQEEAIQIALDMLENKAAWKKPAPSGVVHSYMVATIRIELEPAEFCEMSNYLLRLDSVHGELKPSPVVVIHQDSFLIPRTMRKIQLLFDEIVRMPHDTLKKNKLELRKKLGLIRYLFAQATPLDRGSADCAGAIERVLTPAKDLPLLDRRDAVMEMDLEALTSDSLASFMSRYMESWNDPKGPGFSA